MRAARALRVGRGAARALHAAGAAGTAGTAGAAGAAGEVELVSGGGGYVRLGDEWILLGGPRAPFGPLSLLVAGLPRHALRPGIHVHVEPGALVLGTARIALRTARAAGAPRSRPLAPGWREALAAAEGEVPQPPPTLRPGLAALAEGRAADAVTALAGRGEGLTPAGDDVLAGHAAWAWASGERRAPAANGCSSIGHAYLRCAARGELPAVASLVLEAVRAGDARAARRRARGLAGWGASSGAALLWGMAAGG